MRNALRFRRQWSPSTQQISLLPSEKQLKDIKNGSLGSKKLRRSRIARLPTLPDELLTLGVDFLRAHKLNWVGDHDNEGSSWPWELVWFLIIILIVYSPFFLFNMILFMLIIHDTNKISIGISQMEYHRHQCLIRAAARADNLMICTQARISS